MADSDGAYRIEFAETLAANIAAVMKEIGPQLKSKSSIGSMARGKLFEITKNYELSITSYRDAVENDDQMDEALARLVIVELQAGKHEDALRSAITLAGRAKSFTFRSLCLGEEYSPMTLLGEALLLNDRTDSAQEAFEKALKANKNDTFAAGRLAYILLAKGENDAAAKLASTVSASVRYRQLEPLLRFAAKKTQMPFVKASMAITIAGRSMPGRPITVNGDVRVAGLSESPDWCLDAGMERIELSEADTLATIHAWTKAGLGEHASIAAFARFVLQLLGLGAPPDLVRDAIRAMADEVAHASDSFMIAGHIAGAPVGPGNLDVSDILADGGDKRRIFLEAVHEGCIGESISAEEAMIACEHAEDPIVKRVLTKIAKEEAGHGDLAWRFVEWMLHDDPDLADEININAALEAALSDGDDAPQASKLVEKYGVLTKQTKDEVKQHAIDNKIRPRLMALVKKAKEAKKFASRQEQHRIDLGWLSTNGLDRIPA
ncbi:hypothetical protein QA649_02580 [Bradyrhizobium sp. CB1717]|uniref:hypothetical protein n=1 Tax=Bradyrhizobium sp. CB1717 TaxID=3039154 RepID=UPI0024B18939|nr:hypothetical protein [Bradyrhizobium sp. CB1717]WFU25151.1 hypothetical protein QA649_02580 [Bradyrhizobium sp. CB1717]